MATQPAVRTAADILGTAPAARGVGKSQATVVEQSRAIAEVQGALVVAANRPRDKSAALNEALESCRTREVAEGAFFKFSRGGSTVAGETIHLARELARCWGNIVYDVMELERDDDAGHSEMMARAWDLETNAQARLQFIVPHLRDKKGGPSRLTDVRDIYENNANMGARRLRECIFAVLPPYLVKSAADECRATLERGEGEEPIPVRVSKLLTAFAQIGIDKARIEAKFGTVDKFTPVDLANLRVSYQSIRRNEITAEEEFPRADGEVGGPSKLDMLEEAIEQPRRAARTAQPATAEDGSPGADAGPANEPAIEAAPAQPAEEKPSLQERMTANADAEKQRQAAGKPAAETLIPALTLEAATAEIDRKELVTDIRSYLSTLPGQLSEDDLEKARDHGLARIAELETA